MKKAIYLIMLLLASSACSGKKAETAAAADAATPEISAPVKADADWAKVYPNVNVSAFLNAIADYGTPIPLAAQNATPARTTIQEYVGYINYCEYETAQEALDAMAEAVNDALAD